MVSNDFVNGEEACKQAHSCVCLAKETEVEARPTRLGFHMSVIPTTSARLIAQVYDG